MASVINTNIAATRTHNVYNRNNEFMNAAMTRVATGMKINSAKDGASTWAISEKMRERIRANDQANQNVQNDTAMLKTAQGGISNTIDILKTLKERAVNAANGSNTTADRDRIATEVQELLAQINDNADKVKFNGRKLLDGTGGSEEKSTFTPTEETSSTGSVTPPTAATIASAKGNSAVFHLVDTKFDASASDTTALTDVGFAAGDVIEFSWKEDGGSVQKKSFTVGTDANTVGDLAFTQSKLSVTHESDGTSLADQNGVSVTGDATNSATAGLYAVGDKFTKITDFKVSVTDKDGATTAKQADMVFSGLQQSTGVVASNTVYTADFSGLHTASGAATESTALKDLGDGSSGYGLTAGKITVTWDEDGTSKSADVSVAADGSTKVEDLFAAAGIKLQTSDGNITLTDSAGNKVTDKDGKEFAGTSGTIYAIADSGKSISNLTFAAEKADNTAVAAAGTDLATVLSSTAVQKAGDAAEGGEEKKSGKTTDLTFFIGGEKGFGITASISSMKVEDLFDGKSAADVSTMFTDKGTAEDAIKLIDDALNNALNEQTKLGAMENRLGYTSDNLTTMNENLEAADSVMRDSDIAKEMTSYMKYAVLSQASQYMMAQASQNAFQVLNLLQQ